MKNNNWYFDNEPIQKTDGAFVKWHNHKFFDLVFQGKVFHGEIQEEKSEERKLIIKINHRVFDVRKKHELDDLISALGLDKPKIKKIKEFKSPMPGRVISISVKEGQEVVGGDSLLSLEAMKMENALKADGTGIVKHILVSEGAIVEKGSVLIEFE